MYENYEGNLITAEDIDVPAILIKIEQEWHTGLTADQLYERTRRYWRCNPERRTIKPRYAIAVARGLTREVYEIDRWEVYPDMSLEEIDPTRLRRERSAADRAGALRRGFIGKVVTDERLRCAVPSKSVRHLFNKQNPIMYINC